MQEEAIASWVDVVKGKDKELLEMEEGVEKLRDHIKELERTSGQNNDELVKELEKEKLTVGR